MCVIFPRWSRRCYPQRKDDSAPHPVSTVIPVAVGPRQSADPCHRHPPQHVSWGFPICAQIAARPSESPVDNYPACMHICHATSELLEAQSSVAPTLISQMTLRPCKVPVAVFYGPPFRHRACIRYSIIRRFYSTYDSQLCEWYQTLVRS